MLRIWSRRKNVLLNLPIVPIIARNSKNLNRIWKIPSELNKNIENASNSQPRDHENNGEKPISMLPKKRLIGKRKKKRKKTKLFPASMEQQTTYRIGFFVYGKSSIFRCSKIEPRKQTNFK